MEIITTLVIWIGAGLIAYAVARNKGRDPIIALAMGLLFGFLALIYYLLAKGSKQYEVKKAKEIINDSEFNKPEEADRIEYHRVSKKKSNESSSGCLVALLVFGGFIGIFVIGAIVSALSNKSGSSTTDYTWTQQANQNTPDYKSIKGYAFPEAVRTAFTQSCIKEAGAEMVGISQSYCACMLRYIELNYSLKEFAIIEKEYLKTGQFPPDIDAATENCLSQGTR